MNRLKLYFLSFICCAVADAPAQSVSNEFWQGQSIYQIITDRFYDGDPSNNNADGNYRPRRPTGVHGGDFKGIEAKLDYIKALGATAIWISPIVLNARGEFHGYAAKDFYRVDPHWGTLEDLREMVRAAHARGLLVIDDIVLNHGGDLIFSRDPAYGKFRPPPDGYTLVYRNPSNTYAPPFGDPVLTNLFHNNGVIQNFDDPAQVVLGELSGLDDFRTETPYVREQMTAIYEYWIKEAGFDGFRIDTVKHVDLGCWQVWCPAIHAFAASHGLPNFFMFGEVEDGSDALCGSFTGRQAGGAFALDSVLDYPLYFKMNKVFARGTAPVSELEKRYAALAGDYDPEARMRLVTFLDNHDQPRFLSRGNAAGNSERLKMALVFLYTARGIPCLYYGTEQAFKGGQDPYNREDMFAGQFKDGAVGVDSFNMTHPLFQWVARLNNFRRLYAPLRIGSQVDFNSSAPGIFAFARRLGTEEVIIMVNTGSRSEWLAGCPTIHPSGTRLVDLLGNTDILTVAGGHLPPLTIPAGGARMLIAQSDRRPLDPVLVSNFPPHDASGIGPGSSVVLQFSEAMDTNSVETAFSTAPPCEGRITWLAGGDTMTFQPASSGFPNGATVYVTLTNGIASSSRQHLFAPYQFRFKIANQ